MMAKTCKSCGIRKPLSEYYANDIAKDGKQVWCKPCVLSRRKDREGIHASNLQFTKPGGDKYFPRRMLDAPSLRTGLTNPQPVAAPEKLVDLSIISVPCPCCHQIVRSPSVEIIIDNYGISEFEARILGAIWRGKGRPVPTERVFDAMYCEDPDGGPSRMKMYEAFKFGLHRLRRRLEGSGIALENVGYRRGFRLVMKERE